MRSWPSSDRCDHPTMSVDTPLWTLTATELVKAYSARTATPSEVVESVIARHDTVNPQLNAVVTLDRDGARTAATDSTARWRQGAPKSALDGVPITIKDNIHVAGLRTTWGSRLYADHVPTRDETPVTRLRDNRVSVDGVRRSFVQGDADSDKALTGQPTRPDSQCVQTG